MRCRLESRLLCTAGGCETPSAPQPADHAQQQCSVSGLQGQVRLSAQMLAALCQRHVLRAHQAILCGQGGSLPDPEHAIRAGGCQQGCLLCCRSQRQHWRCMTSSQWRLAMRLQVHIPAVRSSVAVPLQSFDPQGWCQSAPSCSTAQPGKQKASSHTPGPWAATALPGTPCSPGGGCSRADHCLGDSRVRAEGGDCPVHRHAAVHRPGPLRLLLLLHKGSHQTCCVCCCQTIPAHLQRCHGAVALQAATDLREATAAALQHLQACILWSQSRLPSQAGSRIHSRQRQLSSPTQHCFQLMRACILAGAGGVSMLAHDGQTTCKVQMRPAGLPTMTLPPSPHLTALQPAADSSAGSATWRWARWEGSRTQCISPACSRRPLSTALPSLQATFSAGGPRWPTEASQPCAGFLVLELLCHSNEVLSLHRRLTRPTVTNSGRGAPLRQSAATAGESMAPAATTSPVATSQMATAPSGAAARDSSQTPSGEKASACDSADRVSGQDRQTHCTHDCPKLCLKARHSPWKAATMHHVGGTRHRDVLGWRCAGKQRDCQQLTGSPAAPARHECAPSGRACTLRGPGPTGRCLLPAPHLHAAQRRPLHRQGPVPRSSLQPSGWRATCAGGRRSVMCPAGWVGVLHRLLRQTLLRRTVRCLGQECGWKKLQPSFLCPSQLVWPYSRAALPSTAAADQLVT